MGLSYWPTKGSRRSGSSQKARRNVSLKFRFRCDSEIRRRISPLRLIDPEEIEIALNCSASACNDLKRFKTRIPDLQTGAILTVLNDGVVQLQFPLCCMHLICASSEKVEFPKCPYVPVVIWLIHQRRLWKYSLQAQLVVNQPGNTTTRGDNWILELAPAETDRGEDFVLLQRKAHIRFPGKVESVPADVILEVNSRIEFDSCARMIFHHVLQGQVPIESLQTVGQAVVGAAKIVTLVFDASSKVPFPSDQKSMVVAEVVVKRIAMPEFGFLKIAL